MSEEMNAEQQSQEANATDLAGQARAEGGDSGQQTEQSFPDFEIKHNGQVVKIPYANANEFLSKGYDYTQKTQELARERDSLKPYQEAMQYLQANPELAQKTYDLWAGQQAGQGVDPVQQKVSQLEYLTHNLIQENSRQKVDSMLDKINNDTKYESLFKDSDMEKLLLASTLEESNLTRSPVTVDSLKSHADKIHAKILKLQVKSEKAGEQKIQENLKSPTRQGTVGKGTYSPPANANPAKSSWDDLRKQAIEMI